MYVWHTAPIRRSTISSQGDDRRRAGAGLDAVRLSEARGTLFGWKFKVITGYEATPKIHLAMERGEVHGTWANWSTLKAHREQWIKDKKIRILAQWALRKHPRCRTCRSSSIRPRPRSRSRRCSWRWRGSSSAGRSSCRRTCRRRGRRHPPRVRRHDEGPDFLDEADKLKIEIDPLTGEQVRR
jgi:hypothetical protein